MKNLYHPVAFAGLTLEGNLFLAPIAGYSDRAFRSICIENGAAYCTTEMVSAEALTRGSGKTQELMTAAPNEKIYAIQLFGGKGETVAKAAEMVLKTTNCTSIDINGGCPVPKILKSGAGSCLTKDPHLLYEIVSRVKKAVLDYCSVHPKRGPVPVTIKIRSGWDANHITWKDCAQAALDAGADAITIHARTRAQGYEGKADWTIQRQLVDFIQGRIPVFGSGDANSPESAKAMLEETGVDGVMFARGAMGDPFIFKRTKDFLLNGTYQATSCQERIQAGFKELEIQVADRGEKGACLEMRKKFCAYSTGIRGGGVLRKQIVSADTIEDYRKIFAEFI